MEAVGQAPDRVASADLAAASGGGPSREYLPVPTCQ
jgi:hypothetical protein